MIRGTSKASFDAVLITLNRAMVQPGVRGIQIGEELFALVDAFDASRALRATVSDPSLPAAERQGIVRSILSEGFSAVTVEIALEIAGQRWTRVTDIADATELLATHAVLADAERRDQLEIAEQELVRVSRVFAGEPAIRDALTERRAQPHQRAELVQNLLGDQLDEVTLALASRAASRPRGRRFVPVVAAYSDVAAERRQKLIADVTSRSELSEAQRSKLNELLTDHYGRPVEVHVNVSPRVIGGLRVQVGADVLDYTVLSRLAGLRRQLAAG